MGVKHDLWHEGRNVLRVFTNRMLRRIFGPKRDRVESGENCITRSFMICTVRQV
jgi:hypothetical protein